LAGAAGLSMVAHLEDSVARRLVVADGPTSISARFRPVRSS